MYPPTRLPTKKHKAKLPHTHTHTHTHTQNPVEITTNTFEEMPLNFIKIIQYLVQILILQLNRYTHSGCDFTRFPQELEGMLELLPASPEQYFKTIMIITQ